MRLGLLCAERGLRQQAVGRLVSIREFQLLWYLQAADGLESQLPVACLLVAAGQIDARVAAFARHQGIPLLALVHTLAGDCDALYRALDAGAAGYLELAAEGSLEARLKHLLYRALPVLPPRVPLVAIGASAGGPAALRTLLSALPAGLGAAVLVVQHFESSQLEVLRTWLAEGLSLPLRFALAGLSPRAGEIYLAGAEGHLELDARGVFAQAPRGPIDLHCPSVDRLFLSLVQLPVPGIAVLLTGMGQDGAHGLRALKAHGWTTLVQDAASSTVDGMPRAARERDAATRVAPLESIAGLVLACLGERVAA